MTLLKEFNLMENKKVIFWLNVATIPLLFFFSAVFTFVTSLFFGTNAIGSTFTSDNLGSSLFSFVLFFVLFFILIVTHELIHGLFFKLFNREGKVQFGFKNGMAYAASPNSYYKKSRFIIICLAPFILITTGLFLLLSFDFMTRSSFVLYASLHASACVGDFYWVYLLARFKGEILVEDTEEGMKVYSKKGVF